MKKNSITIIALLLAVLMTVSVFASCANKGGENETQNHGTTVESESQSNKQEETATPSESGSDVEETSGPSDSESTQETESTSTDKGSADTETESSNTEASGTEDSTTTEASGKEETESGNKVANKNDNVIELADSLANGVQAYFTDASRTHFSMQNLEMTMNYSRANTNKQLVESIKNTKGATYVQNTMDVFVRMNSGNTYFASGSTKTAEVNLYRFGYYYYEGLFEFQNFASSEYALANPTTINVKGQTSRLNQMEASTDGENPAYIIVDPADPDTRPDPWLSITKKISFPLDKNDAIVIVAKALGDTTGATFYLNFGSGYKEGQTISVPFVNNGEYNTYYIPLSGINGYTESATLIGIRIDPNGTAGGGIAVEGLAVGGSIDLPNNLSINRHFHVYSDKMHQAVQFAVTEKTENIAEVGMLTEIGADTVSKLMVVTSDDKTYTSLDAGFSWDDVIAVGFDIKDAGIFGFILPADEIAGKIKVELKDGVYVIEQTRTPSVDGVDGVIIPSIDTTQKDKNGKYIHAEGVKNNGNDFYIGQRIYTDENHDFGEFIKETSFERHPLDSKMVNVASGSDGAQFQGYDAMRGIYYFTIATPPGGFYTPYNSPQRNYKVNFMIRSDVDRDIYVMTKSSGGLLECAVLMDEDDMLLPVPIEVIKNFSEALGERNLYNISDPTFSEAIFCISLKKSVRQQYTIINLYQNWGNYPLKQLSQIPFHCPYYHLSTGVTETNCVLPWFGCVTTGKTFSSTLPDFRSMSAPFWKSQPQHNSCGSHSWLRYTDTEGVTYSVESQINYITSYGPTYAELVWENLSDDGKIKVTYTHMEMPQTDENRTYYTMEYEFLEDLTIESFKNNFRFYTVTDNSGTGTYKKLGYLNEQNKSVVIDSNQDATQAPEYVLGDQCPYFSFFMMPDWDRESTSVEGYSNLAFLVYNSEFMLGGEAQDYRFLIQNPKDEVIVTLDIDGTVEFMKGDKITINAILLPWGSQQYEDGITDLTTTPPNYEYTDVVGTDENGDPIYYMDKNVRDVRENTLLNPLTVQSETDEIIESPFVPKVRSKDGKTAEFTLSGGENNVAVRIYGFNMLTAPTVEEYVNGEWVEYVLSSKNNPDSNGYYHYYDGYMVNYDEDGTYSYSFVTTMYEGAPRKFRIKADKAFSGWPDEILPESNEDFLSLYYDYDELYKLINNGSQMFGTPVMGGEDDEDPYTSIFVKTDNSYGESYLTLFSDEQSSKMTGQYFVIKYRVPATNQESIKYLEIYTSTITNQATQSGCFAHVLTADGEWHVDIIDLSQSKKGYTESDDGGYYAKLLRVDIFNGNFQFADTHVDIAYIGVESDIGTVCELESGKMKVFNFFAGKNSYNIDVETGEPIIESYIDPSSGYTESTEKFGALLDSISGVNSQASAGSSAGGMGKVLGVTVSKDLTFSAKGWCGVNGGIEKYVYSVDGGKTWKDCSGAFGISSQAIINAAAYKAGSDGYMFDDPEATKIGGAFQGAGLIFDLSDYEGQTVTVILAAVPKNDTKTLALLFCFENIKCIKPTVLDPASQYTESSLSFASQIDSVNGTPNVKTASSAGSYGTYDGVVSVNENGQILLRGWCALDGGVSKYIWTPDNGKTWYDVGGTVYNASEKIVTTGQTRANATFADLEASKKNGAFQDSGILIDLTPFKDSTETMDIFVCAVTETNPEEVAILYLLKGVSTNP